MRARYLFSAALLAAGLSTWAADSSPPGPAPERIVSLLPSHTETLAALGALDRLVAVSDAEDARVLPGLPRLGSLEPSWEALAALKPDLVLADRYHRRFEATFQRLGLRTAYLAATDARTVEDVLTLVTETGAWVGCGPEALRWVETARARARLLDQRRLPAPGPRVFFEVWPQPLQACGPRSWQGHLLERVGAVNVVADTGEAMPLVSAEAAARAAPEIFLHMSPASDAEIRRRPGWDKTMLIVSMNQDLFSRAGPRVLEAWEALLRVLARP